jgi:hypothetical protein
MSYTTRTRRDMIDSPQFECKTITFQLGPMQTIALRNTHNISAFSAIQRKIHLSYANFARQMEKKILSYIERELYKTDKDKNQWRKVVGGCTREPSKHQRKKSDALVGRV